MQSTGKFIIIAALVLLVVGVIVYFFGDKLGWIGNLPGDIRYEKGNTRVFFPIVTMILLSLVLNLIIYVFKKF